MSDDAVSSRGTEHLGPCANRCGNVVWYTGDWEDKQPTCDDCGDKE